MGGADQVTVRRLAVRCEVPRDHPSPERARERVEEVARGPLPAALGRVLAPLASLRSDEVVLIRRLDVELDLDLSRDPAELARRVAARVAESLAAVFAEGSVPAGMLRFADEAHYLARFLVDAAAGVAWDRWYYRRYAGLRPLPAAAALRTAIVEEPGRGMAALVVLAPGDLVAVLQALGGTEARRIVEAVAEGASDGAQIARAAEAVARAAPAWRALALGAAARFTAALALLAVAAADLEADALPAAAALVAAMVARAPAPDGSPAGAVSTAAVIVGAGNGGPVRAQPQSLPEVLRRLPEAARAQLLRAITGRSDGQIADTEAPPRYTRFGGVVLLLPHIAALPLAGGWYSDEDRALARLHILARCAGPTRAADVIADPTLRYLCGVTDDTSAAHAIERLSKGAPGFERALVIARLAAARSVELTVGRRPTSTAAGTALVVVGWPAGEWLLVTPLSPATRAALRSDDIAAATAALAAALLDDLARTAAVNLRPSAARRITRALRHLTLPPHLAGPDDLDRALTLAAQPVMRGFARRLPEFAESSPGYLYDSFLACDATVEESHAGRVCRLGRPPLSALLHLFGVSRGTIALPWLGDAPFELRTGARR